MEVDELVGDVGKPNLKKSVDLNEALDEIVFEDEEEEILSKSQQEKFTKKILLCQKQNAEKQIEEEVSSNEERALAKG